jgi:F0F1-type ATP synthase assembly protein I
MEWASRITAICFEMCLPALLGYWIDRRLGTTVVFTIVGGVLGMVGGMMSLVRMTRSLARPPKDRNASDER